MSDELHALGVRLGMDGHCRTITADEIYAHVLWLEKRATEQAAMRIRDCHLIRDGVTSSELDAAASGQYKSPRVPRPLLLDRAKH